MIFSVSQNEISIKLFFEGADAAQISHFIVEQFDNGERTSIIEMLGCILDARLEKFQLDAVIATLEDQFLKNHPDYLSKYLFVLHDRNGNDDKARFYLDLCSTTQHVPALQDEEEYIQRAMKYSCPEAQKYSSLGGRNIFDQAYDGKVQRDQPLQKPVEYERKQSPRRIRELAKELDLKTQDIVAILKEHSIPVKSHMHILSAEEINIVREYVGQQTQVDEKAASNYQNSAVITSSKPPIEDLITKGAEEETPLPAIVNVKRLDGNNEKVLEVDTNSEINSSASAGIHDVLEHENTVMSQSDTIQQGSAPKAKKRLRRRIHELAKDLNIRTKDVIAILERYSIPVKNHMQLLSDEEINIVVEYLMQQKHALKDVANNCQNNDSAARREAAIDTMGKRSTEEKQLPLSDVMIVKCSDDNYYVSEKIAGREVYYNLLEDRSYTSNHYSSIAAARAEAEELRRSLLDRNPDCEIKEYDINDFPKRNAKIVRYVNDNNGNVLFGVSEKGKKIFVCRAGEEEYQYIDILKYKKRMDEEAALYSNQLEFDYKNLGLCRGIEVARMASLQHLYYEIYKAEELIKTFSDDPELFECDSRFYSGYINSIKKAIEIQKECVVTKGNWRIILLNYKGIDLPQLKKHGTLNFLGSYTVDEYKSASECNATPSERDIYIILAQSKDGAADLIREIGPIENIHYIFDTRYFESKNINRVIERLITKHFRLSAGDADLKIPEYWVETIEQFDDDDDADSDSDFSDAVVKPSLFGTSAIPDRLSKSYRFTIAAMFSDYSLICADDISCLMEMCNRCIKHDQNDWKTTFEYLGSPALSTLQSFVSDAGKLRDSIRDGSHDGVIPFREKYQEILLSMLKKIGGVPSD